MPARRSVEVFLRGGSCFYYIQDGPVLPSDSPAAEEVFYAILERSKNGVNPNRVWSAICA